MTATARKPARLQWRPVCDPGVPRGRRVRLSPAEWLYIPGRKDALPYTINVVTNDCRSMTRRDAARVLRVARFFACNL